jgi:hypothetical protein
MFRRAVLAGIAFAAAFAVTPAAFAATPYDAEIAAWRQAREAALRADTGWLTVAGLFWLSEGATRFGAARGNEIVLPDGPNKAGQFIVQQDRVTVQMGGAARELRPGPSGAVKVGRLSLILLGRPGAYAIRLRDPESAYRRDFRGIESFPVRPEYRVTARFVPGDRTLTLDMSRGEKEDSRCPGYAVFDLGGRPLRLYALLENPNARTLWFIFRDQTAGKETYPAGRFLDAELPRDGQVVLDFNKAYNPPCAFSPYLTCPLPPRENRLPVRIEAGEKSYGH